MRREKRVEFKVTGLEWEKLTRNAQHRQVSASELLRDLIKELPEDPIAHQQREQAMLDRLEAMKQDLLQNQLGG